MESRVHGCRAPGRHKPFEDSERLAELVEVGTWNMPVADRRFLLFTLAAVSPLEIELAAEQLRSRGATEVHACGVRVSRGEEARGVDSYRTLTLQSSGELRAVGAA